ncbi:hypothetical protein [Actinomadura atramentaria]|uniref:hypothetical protein n=1 Tax=Actinomadura atramentaria TaxID=1990 RepID=UPI00037B749E|nr:hypothetical protein [Actinomadura atramentaria]
MRGAQIAALADAPDGVAEALAAVDGFDDALVHGLARLDEEREAALAALAGAVGATPLGGAAADAAAKVTAGSVAEDALAALAGGRAAVLGAVHDALLASADEALGRERAAWDADAATGDAHANLLGGCRAWLTELAVTGWRGVDHDLVSGADRTVEAVLAEPALRRLGVLLDGLAGELRASCPVGTLERLPVRRWADLWTRAVLLAARGPWSAAAARAVSGRLLPLGVDVHEHPTAVGVEVHAILEESGGSSRLVRTSLLAPKTDTIVGPAVWRLLAGFPVLLGALAERRGLVVTDLPLTPGGDLIWDDERAAAGDPADPFVTARVGLAAALAPPVPPLDRHPVRISEPVLLEGYRVKDGRFELDGQSLAVETDRLPAAGPLTEALVKASSVCIGLLRSDAGGWSVRPLAVRATVRKAPVEAHNGDWALGPTDPKVQKAEAKAGDSVAVLRERAGRLLRA